MSTAKLDTTLDRVKSAGSDSPIVVAKTKREGYYESFFYNTVYGREFVRLNPPNLIGVFHGGMDAQQVAKKLRGGY